MGAKQSAPKYMEPEGIYRSNCEKRCPMTRYYRISQATRRDQFSTFQIQARETHNKLRRKHALEPLVLNVRLCKMADSHANWLAENEIFEHSTQMERRHSDGYCGENLAETLVWHDDYQPPNGEQFTMFWYEEGKEHYYESNKFNVNTAQFTQVIWKKTAQFGIAFAEYEPEDMKGYIKTVVVANYYPGGNIDGRYLQNVFPGYTPSTKTGLEIRGKLQRKIDEYEKKKKRQLKQCCANKKNLGNKFVLY